jgi:hypothetical protein
MIQREISRVLVLNLSGNASSASARHRISLSLTEPSLLSRGTHGNVKVPIAPPETTVLIDTIIQWPCLLAFGLMAIVRGIDQKTTTREIFKENSDDFRESFT